VSAVYIPVPNKGFTAQNEKFNQKTATAISNVLFVVKLIDYMNA
jgi:hypothetical protein